MSTLDDRRLLEELYLPPADEFVLVDVPDLQFVMIDGDAGPDNEAFARPFGGSSPWSIQSSGSPRSGFAAPVAPAG